MPSFLQHVHHKALAFDRTPSFSLLMVEVSGVMEKEEGWKKLSLESTPMEG